MPIEVVTGIERVGTGTDDFVFIKDLVFTPEEVEEKLSNALRDVNLRLLKLENEV